MKACIPTLQAHVQDFFVKHLAIERNASDATISSYRDAIKLFLQYAAESRNCGPDQLDHAVLDTESIRGFLDWLKRERGSRASTRNHRLAALKSFARYVASVAPEQLERCRLVREMRSARVEHKEIQYLAEDEVVQLIAGINVSTPAGRRDRALLLLLYNTGARVHEVINLNLGDIDESAIPIVRLLGKGRKQRSCPLWARTIGAIRQMLADRTAAGPLHPLFLSARGQRLSRSGVAYLLTRAKKRSGIQPRRAERLSPHVIRHTTAMHLLQSGVDITTVAAWLGHAHLNTTHGYVEIDLRTKQAAIANEAALPGICAGEYPSSTVIDWLESLARGPSYVQHAEPNDLQGPRGCRAGPSLHITARCG